MITIDKKFRFHEIDYDVQIFSDTSIKISIDDIEETFEFKDLEDGVYNINDGGYYNDPGGRTPCGGGVFGYGGGGGGGGAGNSNSNESNNGGTGGIGNAPSVSHRSLNYLIILDRYDARESI